MKELIGSPGMVSGLLLRIGQFLFAAASIGVMASAPDFSNYTAFCYLIASMGLQVLWSFGLACLDVYALRIKRDLQNPVLVSLFVVGDWVFATRDLSQYYIHQIAFCEKGPAKVLPIDISAKFPGTCLFGNVMEITALAFAQPDCSFD